MARELLTQPAINVPADARPPIASYDSGYEHSLEHWVDTQHLVEEAAESKAPSSVPFAAAVKAS